MLDGKGRIVLQVSLEDMFINDTYLVSEEKAIAALVIRPLLYHA